MREPKATAVRTAAAVRTVRTTGTAENGGQVLTDRDGKRTCGARTRRGTPCQAKALLRGGRCKLHGGASTGPRSPAGRLRAQQNLRNIGLSTKSATSQTP